MISEQCQDNLQDERLSERSDEVDVLFISLYKTIISLYSKGVSNISVAIIVNLAEKGYKAKIEKNGKA